MAGKFGKQIMALFLVMLLMASVVSLTVSAATETIDGISIDYENATYSDGTFTVTPAKGACVTATKGTLTINKADNSYPLICSYSAEISEKNGSLKIGDESITESSGTIILAANELTKEIEIASGDSAESDTSSITLSNFRYDIPETTFDITIIGAANGKLTIGTTDIFNGDSNTYEVSNLDGIGIVVTPDPGYTFFGFINNNTNEAQDYRNNVLYPNSESAIIPIFAETGIDPVFSVTPKLFTDLNQAALESASTHKVIIPLQDCTIPQGNYSLPSGARLLLPFDENENYVTTSPEIVSGSYETPTAYRTITMADGANLSIGSGASVSVAGKLSSSGIDIGDSNGCPTGPDGRIHMEEGSKITVMSGGNLYVWGYIYGNGEVEAKSGAIVYEALQIKDWLGTVTGDELSKDTFMFSQYYVQNIEVPLKLNYGATEKVCSSLTGLLQSYSINVTFIGNDGIFKPSSGYIIKDYIESEDRVVYQLNGGNTTLNSKQFTGYFSVDFFKKCIPLTSNMTIDIKESGTLTISHNTKLLPGAVINIDEGSSLMVSNGNKVYLYDQDDWGNYTGTGKMYPVGYSVANGTTTIRDEDDLVDAKIDVNGTVDANGLMYTSSGGADISSSQGTGVYNVLGAVPANDVNVYEYVNVKNENESEEESETDSITYTSTRTQLTFSPAKLHNSGDSYTETKGSSAGTTFYYDDEISMWHSTYLTKWYDVDGTTLLEVQESSAALDSDSISSENKPATTSSQTLTWTDCGSPKSDASRKVKAYKARILENNFSITLGGEIGLNLYIPMASVPSADRVTLNWGPATGRDHGEAEFNIGELTDADSIIYHFSDGGLNTHNPLAKAKTFGEYYKFTAYVAAKQMTDDITVSIYDSGNTLLKTYSYCVADYCSLVIANEGGEIFELMNTADPSMDAEKFAKLQELCKAMLTYGAQAQTQFSYNTGNPADKDLEGYTYTPANASEFEAYGSDAYMSDVGDMTFYGSSMLLEAETTYSLWFRYENAGYEPPAATATIGGRTFTVEKMKIEGNYDAYYVRYNIMNLPANLLAEDITVSFGGTEKTYNAKTYFYLALARSGDATLIDTINSLYNYNRSAVTFFN